MKKRLYIVEDHPIVRQGLVQMIDNEEDLVTCGHASDAATAFREIPATPLDGMLLDLSLGNSLGGLQLIKDLRKVGVTQPILILSMHEEGLYAERALMAGAQGFIMKSESTDTLLGAIRKMLSGQVYLSAAMVTRLVTNLNTNSQGQIQSAFQTLTDRELEVFHMIGKGLRTRDIAERLNLSVKTVETHKEHIKEKMGLGNATALVQSALQWAQTESGGRAPGQV